MIMKLSIQKIEEEILMPLNEILLLAYGTEVYHQILLNIEQTVRDLDKQHQNKTSWQ